MGEVGGGHHSDQEPGDPCLGGWEGPGGSEEAGAASQTRPGAGATQPQRRVGGEETGRPPTWTRSSSPSSVAHMAHTSLPGVFAGSHPVRLASPTQVTYQRLMRRLGRSGDLAPPGARRCLAEGALPGSTHRGSAGGLTHSLARSAVAETVFLGVDAGVRGLAPTQGLGPRGSPEERLLVEKCTGLTGGGPSGAGGGGLPRRVLSPENLQGRRGGLGGPRGLRTRGSTPRAFGATPLTPQKTCQPPTYV